MGWIPANAWTDPMHTLNAMQVALDSCVWEMNKRKWFKQLSLVQICTKNMVFFLMKYQWLYRLIISDRPILIFL